MKHKKETHRLSVDFDKRVMPFIDSLFSTALRLTRNAQDAEDLVQEACLRAYRYRDKFQDGTNFKAWLFKILKNTFINEYRRRKKMPAFVDLADVEDFLEMPGSAEIECLSNSMDSQVHGALLSLTDDYRFVIMLHDFENFSYREIADILEIPIGTVMSRLYRARKQLESTLFNYARSHGYFIETNPERFRDKELLAACA